MFFVLRKRRRVRRPATGQKKYLKHREMARAVILERVAFWNTHYKLEIKRIAIRNSRSRWGSCSKKGNLNFNYKLALIPRELLDYVVVHELCHLREFNHSPNFWAYVAEAIPDHKTRRASLRSILSKS